MKIIQYNLHKNVKVKIDNQMNDTIELFCFRSNAIINIHPRIFVSISCARETTRESSSRRKHPRHSTKLPNDWVPQNSSAN